MRIQVPSLDFSSVLRTQDGHKLQHRSQMWLGSGVAVAVASAALIPPLARELPYATGAAIKKKKIKREKNPKKMIRGCGKFRAAEMHMAFKHVMIPELTHSKINTH